jgi:hypothetical protein
MRRLVWLTLAPLVAAFLTLCEVPAGAGPHAEPSCTGVTGAATPRPGRAVWVWNQPRPAELVRFARSHRVREMYLWVPTELAGTPRLAWVRRVAARTRGTQIRLLALGGDKSWLDHPDTALRWQAAALSTGLFTAAHVDFEPWQHRRWDTNKPAAIAGYLSVLSQLQAASEMPLEADIGFWLGGHDTAEGICLDEAVMRRVDAVTVMTYRQKVSGADSITSLGATALATAARVGIPARLAVETRYLGTGPINRKQTFHGTSRAVVRRALEAVDAVEADAVAYAGMAVHDVAGWRALPRKGVGKFVTL